MAVDYDLGTARGVIDLDASSLGVASAAFGTLGKSMLGFGIATIAGFGYVVKSSADFEKTLSAVKAVTNGTGAEIDALREKALNLATGSIFSANQIAGAFEDLGKAGIPISQILGGAADAVVHLAHAAGDELPGGIAQGAEIIANAMKTFEVSADQAEHFADVLVAAAASSTLSVDDMATSFRYAGPIAHELGLTIDDLAGVLAILGDRGIKGSTAGTSLRGVLLSLTPTSDKAKTAMRELGLITADGTNKFYDLHGNLKPIPEVMQILQDATKGLSEQQKIQAFNTIFQRRAMNAALILADQGAAGFNRYADSIAGLSAADIARTKLDNLSGDMTILKNTINVLVLRAGKPLQDMLREWVQGITGVLQAMAQMDPQTLALIVKIVGIAGAIFTALGAMALLIGTGFKIYKVFKELAASINILIEGFRLLSVTLLTNPLFLVIAAIVALGAAFYLLYTRNEAFREFVDKTFATIKEVVVPIITQFLYGMRALVEAFKGNGMTSDGFVGAMERVGVVLRAIYLYIVNEIVPALVDFGKWLGWLGGEVGERFMSFLRFMIPILQDVGKWFNWLGGEIAERFVSGWKWVQENVGPVMVALGELFSAIFIGLSHRVEDVVTLVRWMGPVWTAIWQGISTFTINTFNIMKAVFTFFIDAVQIIWRNFGDNIWDTIVTIFNIIKGVIEGVLQIITGIIQVATAIITGDWGKAWEGIKNILAGVWQVIVTIVVGAWELLKLTIRNGIDFIITAFQLLWAALKDILPALWDAVVRIFRTAIDIIVGIFKWLYDTLVGHSIIPDLMRALYDWFMWLPTKIYEIIRGFINSAIVGFGVLRDSAGRIIGDLINTVLGIAGRILDTVRNFGSLLFDAGKRLIQGLIDGISNRIQAVRDVIGTITGVIGRFFPGSPVKEGALSGSHEPNQLGRAIVRGIVSGMSQELAGVAQISNMIAGRVSAIPSSSTPSSNTIGVSFVFPNVTSSSEAGAIKAAIGTPEVLAQLTRSLRAGVGSN